jgi:2-iminobutanoate/2-iminopropanoate deaminase
MQSSLLFRYSMFLVLINLLLYSCSQNESTTNKSRDHVELSSNTVKQIINTDAAPKALGPYNQAVQFGELVFVSGQIAIDPSTGIVMNELDIEEQSILVLQNLQSILQAQELDFKDVLKTTVFLTNMEDYSKFNSIYAKYFDKEFAPARVLVEVAALPAGVQVEISLIAGVSK